MSPWLLVAFLVGSIMPSMPRAAVAGVATLLFALLGYNVALQLQLGYASSLSASFLWVVGAVAGGPTFGIAGRAWRVGTPRQRAIALGLLAAVAVLEGLRNAIVFSYVAAGATFIIAGLLLPLIMGRSRQDRGGAYVAALLWLFLGVLGYVAFDFLAQLIAGI
jgi:Family of unknown function (DUF6518)